MTPARDIESPGGSELLTTSIQTYGFPGDVQPEPSSDSISISYGTPTYPTVQRERDVSPGASGHGGPSFSKSAAAAPVTAIAANAATTMTASFNGMVRRFDIERKSPVSWGCRRERSNESYR